MKWFRRVWTPRVAGAALLAALLSWTPPLWSATGASLPAQPAAQSAPRESYDGPPLLLGDGRRKVKLGAYGGLGAAYTRFMGQDSGLASLEGALLFDHRLSLGLVGYGFTRRPRGPDASDGSAQEFTAGYGGFVARYAIYGRLPVYSSFGLLLGAAAVNLRRDYGSDEEGWGNAFDDEDNRSDRGRFDPFMVVQPEVMLHANVTRWLRFGAMLGYRITGGVGRFGLDESDLNGIVAGGNLQLGWF